eukprot:Gregarina_sp_Poly_1__4283@NODE_232_length_11105_cov_98_544211_g205_i0_p1_GENE_NODE_232_length_11105_cov_98_544211_g205_i0NODE_232_length_11105_cov_98_544211_g205_i0_p1_ORF_typecomplete_len1029_score172_03GTP_EFTU/PF00009_27/9e33EFTUD2/PF16004_5/1_1e29EFTUD2/PF16004_5/4_6e03EFG_IV/PF03764_18/4e21EFG_C/PF00679_24/4_4e17GTP_EFTU_D2/PF03144_25/7_9e12EFG_II/PF14492_6/3e10MMR_HSR1/PF01926_23/0_001SRPRB/PF09439_10/0_036GBP/PF02263_19/0_064_NODE_232_length_11105_cov_98_544211_g205_i039937079
MENYDEFGNYIGPDLGLDEDEEEEYDLEDEEEGVDSTEEPAVDAMKVVDTAKALVEASTVVPHEEKQYYPSAEDVYAGAEVLVQEEDTQPITEPIIAPARPNEFDLLERQLPETTFNYEFVQATMKHPQLVRHVCLVGHLHHGKTSLMDLMVDETHSFRKPIGRITDEFGNIRAAGVTGPDRTTLRARRQEARTREMRYTDNRVDEQERGISIKATPLSLILSDSRQKSYLINLFDTPGHINFLDEAVCAMRLCDGAVIVVDALEGPMIGTRKLVEALVHDQLDLILVISCIDRLILELRLPPADAFHKIRYIIKEVNELVSEACRKIGRPVVKTFSPAAGNVGFASGRYNFIFTLESIARIYKQQRFAGRKWNLRTRDFDVEGFARLLWGDVWLDPKTRCFQKSKPEPLDENEDEVQRTFVQFVLEPLYKLMAHAVAEEKPTLEPTLAELGVYLNPEDYLLDTKSLLKKICSEFFVDSSALVDMIVKQVQSPAENAERKTLSLYSGNLQSSIAEGMRLCSPEARLMIVTAKNYHRPDGSSFDVFGRVMSGTITRGQMVRVLGENYTLDDDEDVAVREISHLWIYQGRYRVEVSEVTAGNWVLIGGVDPSVRKTATITSLVTLQNDEVEVFHKLVFPTTSVIRIGCEPLNPSELPKMLEGLRKIDRSYPLMKTKVEDSGEHVLIGSGELYLDCALHDLRKLYGDLELKCADPVVQLCETVIETSAMKAFGDTPNKKNRISLIAERLEPGLESDIELGKINASMSVKELSQVLMTKYEWDALSARSVWAFSSNMGTNMLVNEILPTYGTGRQEKKLLEQSKDFIIHGFQWATREGPLIEEEVRNVKLKMIDALLAPEPINRNGGQLIPTVRRVAYSAMLLATPKLMEPMLFAEIVCPADCVPAVINVLQRRRGHLTKDLPNPGTPLETLHAYIPAIDSFGFETDIRTHTSGQAFVLSLFHHWETLPGDPLDTSIVLRPLEPAPAPHLAREFLLKIRRRKGLSGDVSVQKYFDDAMLVELAKRQQESSIN